MHPYYYTNRMQMSPHKYVLFYPFDRISKAFITKIAAYLRIRYSHESVIFFVFLGLLSFKLRLVCVF